MINRPGEYGVLCHIVQTFYRCCIFTTHSCLYIIEQNKVQCITVSTMILIKARHYSSARRKYAGPGLSSITDQPKSPTSSISINPKNPVNHPAFSIVQQTQWINNFANSMLAAVSFTTVTATRVLQFIIVLIRISVMALLTLIAFTLRIVAYVVNFFLIDSIWLSKKLCLYALNSLKVVCLYIVDTSIAAFGVFKVIFFLMECPQSHPMMNVASE